MSLVQKPKMTEENRAAHGRNGRQSRGAATPEGKERSRAANLRHGMYSKLSAEALPALGEDPAELAVLIEGAYEQWRPANASQARMVEHWARLQWRLDRAERMQENLAAQHVERVVETRRKKALELRYCWLAMEDALNMLQGDAARPDFYVSAPYWQRFTKAFEGDFKKNLKEILPLLYQLRKPRRFEPAPGPLPPGATSDEDWQETLEETAGDEFSLPALGLPLAEGAERSEVREELRELAAQTLESLRQVWQPALAEQEAPLSTGQRDEVVTDLHARLDQLRRNEDSCFRQFWRLSTLLMKIQDRAQKDESEVQSRKSEAGGGVGEHNEAPLQEQRGNGVGARPGAPLQAEGRAPAANEGGAGAETAAGVGPNGVRPRASTDGQGLGCGSQDSAPKGEEVEVRARNNASAPGDVQENKGKGKSAVRSEIHNPRPLGGMGARLSRLPGRALASRGAGNRE